MEKATFERYRALYREELLEYTLPFWLANAPDPENGGIFSCLDRGGKVYSSDKSVWMQGRCAWTFSHLCNRYGVRREWLALAKSCLDFLDAYCIDPADGRLYFTVTRQGMPLRKRRYFFSETFYILGSAEYALAAGDTQALENARRYYDFVCEIYQDPARDPYKITPKTIPETRRCRALADSMILINVTAVMRRCDPARRAHYDEMSRLICGSVIRYHYKEELGALLENVGPKGEFYPEFSAGRVVNPGHGLEAAWFLLDEAAALGDKGLEEKARAIYAWAMERGWDGRYGGLLYFTDVLGCPPEQYEHDMKLWWPHNEAVIAALKLYAHTGEERYWADFEKISRYAFDAFSDRSCGEWYGYLRRDGQPTQPPCKGSTYKGPFHLPRMLITAEEVLGNLESAGE